MKVASLFIKYNASIEAEYEFKNRNFLANLGPVEHQAIHTDYEYMNPLESPEIEMSSEIQSSEQSSVSNSDTE